MKTSQWPINIPNILTVGRILLTPLFVILLLKGYFFLALLTFTLAGISDGLDGFIARCFNQRTVIGAYLDPIADKFLLIAAYVTLAVLDIVPGWISVLVISRDTLILAGIAVFTFSDIRPSIRPTLLSKCTTAAQLGLVFIALLEPDVPLAFPVALPVLWLTAALTICSGLHYMLVGVSVLQKGLEKNHQPDR